jgi:single-stranded-DNA-specific exonuclease
MRVIPISRPDLVTQLLLARGVPRDDLERHRNPFAARLPARSLRCSATWTPPPNGWPRRVLTGEDVTVYGDYDVDGATSAAC